MRTNNLTRALSALTFSLTIALGATACSSSDDNGTAAEGSTTERNDADVAFATGMLQHHAQALSMVELTVDRSLDPEVQRLAEQIRQAQGSEIQTFSDWLTGWGEEVPETTGDSMGGMGSDMPGMMSAEDMQSLENAPDSEFQTRWLEMMIDHHEGAVRMARDEVEDGQYQPAIDLAKDIVTSQSEEIDTMKGLLK